MTNNLKKTIVERRFQLVCIVCAVLLLALIVVSAFAYTWNQKIDTLELQNQGLRAINDVTTINSMNEEIGNTKMQVTALQNDNEALRSKVAEYEAILTENGLLPE